MPKFDNITDEYIIDVAVKHFRKHGFPYEKFADYEILQIFRDLQTCKSKLVKAQAGLLTGLTKTIGMSECRKDQLLANYFHPHIWDSHAEKAASPIQSFNTEKSLRRSMMLALRYEKEITDRTVRLHLRTVSGTQMCSNFRPSAAKAVYDYFQADDVLDMSTGYGGRLLGFMASKAKGTYTGIDPQPVTCDCNKKMAKYFGQESRVRIICSPFEEVTEDLPKVDLAFTSPPYFRKEVYDESKTQSREKFPQYEAWLNGFIKIVIERTYDTLNKGGHMAINIADVRMDKKIYPLIQDTINISKKCGFSHTETLDIKFPGFGKGLKKWKTEPILVFKKV